MNTNQASSNARSTNDPETQHRKRKHPTKHANTVPDSVGSQGELPQEMTSPAVRGISKRSIQEPLKDADYICRTMEMPTEKGFPLVENVLQNKGSAKTLIHNNLRNNATLKAEFSALKPNGFRCTLTCLFKDEETEEIVVGEHHSKKVRRSEMHPDTISCH